MHDKKTHHQEQEYDRYMASNNNQTSFMLCLLFFCSIHGLVRGENMELGRDSDTGGQVVILPVIFVLINKTIASKSSILENMFN